VEAGGQSGYLAQCQTISHPDGAVRQVTGLSDHALADTAGVLAGTQSQHEQSATSDAVDGTASGCTVNARRKRPATYQLVANPKLIRGLG
jgi:hypothetical protein